MLYSQANLDIDKAFFAVRSLLFDSKLNDLHFEVSQIHVKWRESIGASKFAVYLVEASTKEK